MGEFKFTALMEEEILGKIKESAKKAEERLQEIERQSQDLLKEMQATAKENTTKINNIGNAFQKKAQDKVNSLDPRISAIERKVDVVDREIKQEIESFKLKIGALEKWREKRIGKINAALNILKE